MITPIRRRWVIAPLLCWLGFVAPAGAADLPPGDTTAIFEWARAEGPVGYYSVEVNRNGGGFQQVAYRSSPDDPNEKPSLGVRGQPGDSIVVRVQAISANGQMSEFSQESETVFFVAAGSVQPEPEPPVLGDPADLLDFNADGRAELLVRNASTGDIELWLPVGFSVDQVQADSLDPDMKIVGNADYDGDGYADLLARHPATGHLEIRLLENGEAVQTRGFQIDPDWDVVGSADYGGDGYADFLMRDRGAGDLALWSLRGTQVVDSVLLQDAGAGAEIVASGDYDGDGQHDILWQDGEDLFIWYLNPDDPTRHDEEAVAEAEGSYRVLASGDYDGDGNSDVLVLEERRGEMEMYLFESRRVSHDELRDDRFMPVSWGPEDYSVVSSADFDGDGRCDIVLRHTSGDLLLLYLDGHDAQGSRSLGELPQSWSVDGVGLENPASE